MIIGGSGIVFDPAYSRSTELPVTNNTIDLGSGTLAYRTLYLGTSLVFTTAAAKIIPGATSLTFRNNADSADNLSISNSGLVTVLNGITNSNGAITNSDGGLVLTTAGSSASKLVLIGTGSKDSDIFSTSVLIQEFTYIGLSIQRGTNDSTGPSQAFYKSRSTSGNANTIVQSGDQVAAFRFYAAGGSLYREAASITVEIDATPGSADMPGRIVFLTTPDGSTTPTESFRINSSQNIVYTPTNFDLLASATGKQLRLFSGTTSTNPQTEGAWMQLTSNASAGAGRVDIQTGTQSGANLNLLARSSNGVVYIGSASVNTWNFDSAGFLNQDGTNGGSLVMSRTSTSLIIGAASIDTDITAVTGAAVGLYVLRNTSSNADNIAIAGTGNNALGASFKGFKTRAASAGDANTIVQSGDTLLSIAALGADGASYRAASRIDFICDGTPGASDMPGGIVFYTTADGAASPTQRLKLNASGNLIYSNASFLIAADSGTNRVITICGDTNGSAGSYLSVMSDITNAGIVELATGVAANARLDLIARGANFGINLLTVNLQRWQIDNSGHLAQDTTNGGLLIFNKANTTMRFNGAMGNSTKAPQTVAPDDWVEINIAGTVYYLPAYLV